MDKNILIIIPARGGSKGIPRKNLRTLGGNPLISYSIKTALKSEFKPDVYVSSDDDEILSISQKFGAKIHKRDSSIADDKTTLDPVIYDAFLAISKKESKEYTLIVTLQPTSPLLKSTSLDSAIKKALEDGTDTVISAKDDTHLTWKKSGDGFVPNYEKRVNRQYLTPIFKETGGFLITKSKIMTQHNRIGERVELFLLSAGEEIDIDTYEDWNLCEYYLKRKKILFVVSGYSEIGLGHVYNTLIIANDLLSHSLEFLVDDKSLLAHEKISSKNYPVRIQKHQNILEDIKQIAPDVVINDRLDTDKEYILGLKEMGVKVINFEDLGSGARYADLVINAIYPESEIIPKHYFGHNYFVLRDEFILEPYLPVNKRVGSVLITFGGVDPNNFTLKTLDAIYEYCMQKGISISVVAGFGYREYDSISGYKGVSIERNVSHISYFMSRADVIFTSAGRTTYEVASLGKPTIVMCQNERELTHFFASKEFGFENMGLGIEVSKDELLSRFAEIEQSFEKREYMSTLMLQTNLKDGRARVNKLILDVVESI